MLTDNESTRAASVDGLMEPEELAEVVIDGLRAERFLILPHPEVLEYMRRKTLVKELPQGQLQEKHFDRHCRFG
jgi:hypothetical protein